MSRWLADALNADKGGMTHLKVDPLLRKRRADTRHAALVRRMNLPADRHASGVLPKECPKGDRSRPPRGTSSVHAPPPGAWNDSS